MLSCRNMLFLPAYSHVKVAQCTHSLICWPLSSSRRLRRLKGSSTFWCRTLCLLKENFKMPSSQLRLTISDLTELHLSWTLPLLPHIIHLVLRVLLGFNTLSFLHLWPTLLFFYAFLSLPGNLLHLSSSPSFLSHSLCIPPPYRPPPHF